VDPDSLIFILLWPFLPHHLANLVEPPPGKTGFRGSFHAGGHTLCLQLQEIRKLSCPLDDALLRGTKVRNALLNSRLEDWSDGVMRFLILEFGLRRAGRIYSTAETLMTQRKTNENTLSRNYRNKFDARVKSFFAF